MEAIQLIGHTRQLLARTGSVAQIVGEAWQAQALAAAVGGRLAEHGPPELRADAAGLSEAGVRACAALHQPGLRAGDARAARLTAIADPRATLLGLGELLGDVGIALVGVASGTEEEPLYWACMDAIDAADELRSRIGGMLGDLGEHVGAEGAEGEGDEDASEQPAGAGAARADTDP